MIKNKIALIIFLCSFYSENDLFSQQIVYDTPDRILELIFKEPGIRDYHATYELVWMSHNSLNFLTNKLESENPIEREFAIGNLSKMDLAKEKKIELISPFLGDNTDEVVKVAVLVLSKLNSPMIADLLLNKLENTPLSKKAVIYVILKGLQNSADKKILGRLKLYKEKIEIEKEDKILLWVKEKIEVIELFNRSMESQYTLLQEMLHTKKSDDIRWALLKIKHLKSKSFISILKEFDINRNNRIWGNIVLQMRRDFGDLDFTEEEANYLRDLDEKKRLRHLYLLEVTNQLKN